MPDCESYERLISDRLDSPIDAESEIRLKAHLKNCPSCVEFNKSVIRQRHLLESIAGSEVTDLHDRLKKSTRPRTKRSVWQRRVQLSLPVAAILALLYLGTASLYFFSREEKASDAVTRTANLIQTYQTDRLEPVSAILLIENENSN